MKKMLAVITPVVSNSLRGGGGKLTTLLLLISLLLISSCNGNGGAADSEGETYSPGSSSGSSGGSSGGSGGMTGSSSGGEISAWDIMQMMDGGHAEEAVSILSGGSTDPVVEERGTFEVVLPSSSMNLPDGGWVELEIAGDAYFKGKASADPDGNVRFTVPRQRIGAIITVTLTAFTPDGNPYSTGSKNSLVEEGGMTAFNIPLTDLNIPTVTYTDGMLTNETEGGYKLVRYSYLASPVVYPKFSVTNPYDDGSATMTVELDENPLTGDADTGNITDQSLTPGQHTITVTLSKPGLSSDIRIEKKILVKMKAVKVQLEKTSYNHDGNNVEFRGWYNTNSDGVWPIVHQTLLMKGENAAADGEYTGETGAAKTFLTISSGNTTDSHNIYTNTDAANNFVYLTAPSSLFKFWSNGCAFDSYMNWPMGQILEGFSGATRSLEDLKSDKNFDTGDLDNNGDPIVSGSGNKSRYWISVTLTDAVYTAGTDD